jgi:hypothetical protein
LSCHTKFHDYSQAKTQYSRLALDYLQDNSKRWYCRFVLYRKWYSKATKEKDLDKAIARAHMIYMDYQVKADNNLLVDNNRFKDVANRTIENVQNELDNGVAVAKLTTEIIFKHLINITSPTSIECTLHK